MKVPNVSVSADNVSKTGHPLIISRGNYSDSVVRCIIHVNYFKQS